MQIASWISTKKNVRIYKSSNQMCWIVVWHSIESSGSSSHSTKEGARKQYNQYVPKKQRLRKKEIKEF
jgi:hypothetical protein